MQSCHVFDPSTRDLIIRENAIDSIRREDIKLRSKGIIVELPEQQSNDALKDGNLSTDVATSSSCKLAASLTDDVEIHTKKIKLLEDCRVLFQEIQAEASSMKEDMLTREVNLYYTLDTSAYVENALMFWKDHNKHLPLLSQIAQVYLSMCSSSVPLESMFSTVALICNGKRSSLTSYNFERILLTHNNFDHVKKYLLEKVRWSMTVNR